MSHTGLKSFHEAIVIKETIDCSLFHKYSAPRVSNNDDFQHFSRVLRSPLLFSFYRLVEYWLRRRDDPISSMMDRGSREEVGRRALKQVNARKAKQRMEIQLFLFKRSFPYFPLLISSPSPQPLSKLWIHLNA